jgi:hypothetical protein
MMRPGTVRFGAVIITVVWVCLEVWAVGPVMRESDQASLLEGAVDLVRGTERWSENPSYNYDKQFLSYWVVAAWLKIRGVLDGDGTVMASVREGNLLAATLFVLALLAAVGSQRKWSGVQVAVLYCVLFSPVLAFSGVFLSPNMISAAFLLTLVVMLRGGAGLGEEDARQSVVRIGLVGVISFAATAARQDIILLMPLLALMTARGDSLRGFFKNPLIWALGVGCLIAVAAGFLMSVNRAVLPTPFFVLPTFVTYIAGGLGAVLLLLLVFAGRLGLSRCLRKFSLAGAMLLPLLFYACVLYTPRHLFLAAMALLVTILFDRGREAWSALVVGRLGRIAVILTVIGTVAPWIVGARMSGWKSGRVVTASSTLYPSTDGFWPLGAYGWYFSRLANAAVDPADHNQQVWAAWTQVDFSQLPPGKGAVLSSGLVSYGTLNLAWAGRERAQNIDEADFVLFDDRTLGKRQRGVNSTEGPNRGRVVDLLKRGNIRVVGSAMGQRILLWTDETRERLEPGVSVKLALHAYFGGNDFRLARWGSEEWRIDELEGHRGVVAGRAADALQILRNHLEGDREFVKYESDYDENPWWTVSVTAAEIKKLRSLSEATHQELWVAFGTLPAFMDVRKYGK